MTAAVKLFIYLRTKSCPFPELLSYMPKKGSVLDVGCGFGIFAHFLLTRNPRQDFTGVDPDIVRIRLNRQKFKRYNHSVFIAGTIASVPKTIQYDLVSIIDVLYLLPPGEKNQLIKTANHLTKTGGKIFIKFNPRSFSIRYFLTWLQEVVTVGVLHKTVSHHSNLYFETESEIVTLLKNNNYKIDTIVRLPTPFPFFHPHMLIVGVK